ALRPDTLAGVLKIGECLKQGGQCFRLQDELWARVVLDFACAYKNHPMSRGMILRSLTPLYLARVASFVGETETLVAAEVEDKIEELCLTFENLKPHFISEWTAPEESGGMKDDRYIA